MKTILTTLLASTVLAGATTIKINSDTPTELDFTINWGANIEEWSTHATGQGGSTVSWLCGLNRNRNFYFVEINDRWFPELSGFGLRFSLDPEYHGPVNTALTSLPMVLDKFVLPLETTPYGARFVYRHEPAFLARGIASAVPDTGHAWALMVLGLCGIAAARRLEKP